MRTLWWLLGWLLLAVLVTVLLAATVRAGDCGHAPTPTYPPVVVAETMFVPVPTPYQLFQYVAPPTTPPPVTIAPSLLQQQTQQNDGLDKRLKAIEEALAKLAAGPAQAPATAPGDDGPPVALGAGEPPAAATTAPPQPVSIAAVGTLLKSRCAQCHTAPGRGGVDLFTAQGVLDPGVSPGEVYAAVRGDKMPKVPQKLSASEKALLKAWAKN